MNIGGGRQGKIGGPGSPPSPLLYSSLPQSPPLLSLSLHSLHLEVGPLKSS